MFTRPHATGLASRSIMPFAEDEGVSLLPLNGQDAAWNPLTVEQRDIFSQGGIKLGRDIMLPDGPPDRTATLLWIICDPALLQPIELSCRQHRRDLIEVPEWPDHPNGAVGISQITVVAAIEDQPRTRQVGEFLR